MGLLPQAVFASIYLLLLRRYSGGRHFQSNLACGIFSFTVIVLFPGIGMFLSLPLIVRCALIVGTTGLLAYSVPFLKEDDELEYNMILKRKCITLFIYLAGLGIGFYLGGVHLVQGAIFIGATVAISAIPRHKKTA